MTHADAERPAAESPERAAELRREAEARLHGRAPGAGASAPEDLKALVHELEVHQVELQVQNEELRRAEHALTGALARYREFYEQAPVGYLTLDRQGTVTRANGAAAALWGLGRERLVGRRLESLLDPASRDAGWLLLRDAAAGAAAKARDLRLHRPDGAPRWVSAEAAPHAHAEPGAEPDREPRGFRVVLSDVTERRRAVDALGESEERFRLLIEHTAQAVWETDPEGRALDDAPGFRACYTDWTADDWHERGWLAAVHPDDCDRAWRLWREALATGADFDAELRLTKAGGGCYWTQVRAAPVRGADGRIRKWIGMSVDVTARAEAQAALALADRRKDEFLALLGHELRNPLAAIVSGLEVQRRVAIDDRAAKARDMMERQAGHLARMVDDLLDVSRIARGKLALKRERLDLGELVRLAVETKRARLGEHRRLILERLPQEPLTVDGDPVRLTQVLVNLIGNAEKFTGADGEIRIALERTGEHARISVRDNGIGMTPELLARVFEPFVQADSAGTAGQNGLGIGLTLVRALVELHGGQVEAQSAGLGLGSELRVELPLALGGAPQLPPSAPEPEGAADTHRVLIVDDNRDAADSTALVLDTLGAEVQVAYDGPAALRLLEDWSPTLVLSDLGMPGMDGFELARRLRARFPQRTFRLVAASGWGQEEQRERARACGFDRCLTKPLGLADLQALLAD